MENPFQELTREHRLIQTGLSVLERLAEQVDEGAPDPERLERALRFLVGYADQLHHGKEEEHLFPLLERRGLGREGPAAVIFEEHEEGRRLLGVIRGALAALREERGDEAGRLVPAVRAYTALLREHIEREDEAVFPLAASYLVPGDEDQLARGFAGVEQDGLGPGFAKALEDDLRALAREVLGATALTERRGTP